MTLNGTFFLYDWFTVLHLIDLILRDASLSYKKLSQKKGKARGKAPPLWREIAAGIQCTFQRYQRDDADPGGMGWERRMHQILKGPECSENCLLVSEALMRATRS